MHSTSTVKNRSGAIRRAARAPLAASLLASTLVSSLACGGASPGPASAFPAPESSEPAPARAEAPAEEVAILRSTQGLVRVSVPSGERRVLLAAQVEWCAVDDRAGVVWLVRHNEEERELAFLDLASPEEAVPVASIPDVDEIIIDHGSAGRIGGADPVSFRVGLAIVIAAEPSARSVLGCDGDAAVYCYDEEGQALRPEYRALRAAADAVTLRDPARLASLHARAGDRPLRPPAPAAAELPRVGVVVSSRCREEPESCGQARPLPGTGLWLVITRNDRGDYFHQDESLYDPSTRRFLDPRTGERTPIPTEGGVEGLHVSASGRAFALEGRVGTFDGGPVFDEDDAAPCGFVGGGAYVGGPRE